MTDIRCADLLINQLVAAPQREPCIRDAVWSPDFNDDRFGHVG